MTAQERIKIAEDFIKRRGITDEDLIQDLYLTALEADLSKNVAPYQSLYARLNRVYKDEMKNNEEYISIENISIHYDLESSFFKEELRECISSLLNTVLTERERNVLLCRFGIYDGEGKTLKQTGLEFNMSIERIRQIEAKSLRMIRHHNRYNKNKSNYLHLYLEPENVYISYQSSKSSAGKRF